MNALATVAAAAAGFALYSAAGWTYGHIPQLIERFGLKGFNLGVQAAPLVFLFLLLQALKMLPRLDRQGRADLLASVRNGGLAGLALAYVFWSAAGAVQLRSAMAEAARRGLPPAAGEGLAKADDVSQVYLGLGALPEAGNPDTRKADERGFSAFLAAVSTGAASDADYAAASAAVAGFRQGLEIFDRAARAPTRSWWLAPAADPIHPRSAPDEGGLMVYGDAAAARAVLLARSGDGAGAVDSLRAALVAADAAGSQDSVFGQVAQCSLDRVALDAFPAVLRAAPPGLARQRLLPLVDGDAFLARFRRGVRIRLFARPMALSRLSWIDAAWLPIPWDRKLKLLAYWPFLGFDLASMLRAHVAESDMLDKPYAEVHPVFKRAFWPIFDSIWMFSRVTLRAGFEYDHDYGWILVAAAKMSMARAAVEAEEFRAQNGRWPDAVAELDPFSGQPLKLSPQPDGRLLLYSVGPDLVDGAGAPFDRKTMAGDVAWRLQ